LQALIVEVNKHFYAQAIVKNADLKKIEKGQQVILDFPCYPAVNFGTVTGSISSVSVMQNGKNYAIGVELPHGLVTSNNKHLQYSGSLIANMQVDTRSISLFNYFFNGK
jgi:multidrug resistance efflux pump